MTSYTNEVDYMSEQYLISRALNLDVVASKQERHGDLESFVEEVKESFNQEGFISTQYKELRGIKYAE